MTTNWQPQYQQYPPTPYYNYIGQSYAYETSPQNSSGYCSEVSPIFYNKPQAPFWYDLSENSLPRNTSSLTKLLKRREYKKKKKDESTSANHHLLNNLDNCNLDYGDFDNPNEESSVGEESNNNKKKRVLSKTQRLAANVRERRRMNVMSESFLALRQALPISTGRKRRKMSRLDIVIGALEYISYLDLLLKTEGPIEINFDAYQDSFYFY